MDVRVLLGAAVGLLLVAFGGFYFAFLYRPHYALTTPPPEARTTPTPAAPTPASSAAPAPAGKATPASIDAEIARTEQADIQALLKKHFEEEYKELLANAVKRRNEGASDEEFGRELFAQFQIIMRSKLQFAVAASTAAIDKLAANEIELFQSLATDGAVHCLSVLGKEESVSSPLPADVQRTMRLGTLYRFQAIVDGMPKFRPVNPIRPEEMAAFEVALTRNGITFEEMRSGAFINQPGPPGTPCRKISTMYRVISEMGEETRRKLFSGMFFLGRDK
jgi:hypothetical protein